MKVSVFGTANDSRRTEGLTEERTILFERCSTH